MFLGSRGHLLSATSLFPQVISTLQGGFGVQTWESACPSPVSGSQVFYLQDTPRVIDGRRPAGVRCGAGPGAACASSGAVSAPARSQVAGERLTERMHTQLDARVVWGTQSICVTYVTWSERAFHQL